MSHDFAPNLKITSTFNYLRHVAINEPETGEFKGLDSRLGHAKLIISFSGNFFEKLTRDAGFYFIFY